MKLNTNKFHSFRFSKSRSSDFSHVDVIVDDSKNESSPQVRLYGLVFFLNAILNHTFVRLPILTNTRFAT